MGIKKSDKSIEGGEVMETNIQKLDSQARLTIPAYIRKSQGFTPGTFVKIAMTGNGIAISAIDTKNKIEKFVESLTVEEHEQLAELLKLART